MASIRKEFVLQRTPEEVWSALRDFGGLHLGLGRGFVTACVLEESGAVRRITFANGMEVRERLVTLDEARRRLVYTVEGGRASHHNASAEVLADGAGSRFVWITDLLPDALGPAIEQMMEAGATAMAANLTAGAGARPWSA